MATFLRSITVLMLVFGITPSCEAITTVLFDEGHGQRFLVEREDALDLSKLAQVFKEKGLVLETSREHVSDATLAGVDALVISGAFAPFTEGETAATLRFLQRGGRLSVMLHIAPPLATLLTALHVSFSNGVIREQTDVVDADPLNFTVTRMSKHPLVQRVPSFNVYGAWALLNNGPNVQVVAQTGPKAWVDLNANQKLDSKDAVQTFAVIVGGDVGNGSFLVFGDDAIFQNRFLVNGNEALAKSLAQWLAGGDLRKPARSSNGSMLGSRPMNLL